MALLYKELTSKKIFAKEILISAQFISLILPNPRTQRFYVFLCIVAQSIKVETDKLCCERGSMCPAGPPTVGIARGMTPYIGNSSNIHYFSIVINLTIDFDNIGHGITPAY